MLKAVPDVTAETTCKIYVNQIASEWGISERLKSDGGPAFIADLTKRIAEIFQVDKFVVTPNRSQANGKIERNNRTIEAMLRHYVNEAGNDWDEFLPLIVYAYNSQ